MTHIFLSISERLKLDATSDLEDIEEEDEEAVKAKNISTKSDSQTGEQLFFQLFNSFPNKPWFLCVCSTSLLKTLWEKKNCS